MLRLSALASVLLLGGCSLLPYGPQVEAIVDQGREAAVADRMKFNDDKLSLSLAALCDNSIGAAARMADKVQRERLFALCGLGENEQPGSADKLLDALTTLAPLVQPQPLVLPEPITP